MAATKKLYAAKRRVMITGAGHLWPDTKENHANLQRETRAELTEEQAKPYGGMLVTVGKDAPPVIRSAD
jgi:hypothetical protein